MKSETLIKAWNSTRNKQTRLQIIDNAYCPDDLIYRALFLYDPDKVLDLPNLAIKAMWSEDTFIQTCFSLKQGKFQDRPSGYYYYSGSNQNKVLLYLETIYSNSDTRKLECLSSLNNKQYIQKLLKQNPELISLTHHNTCLSLNLAFHLYSKDVLSYNSLLNHCVDYGQIMHKEQDWVTSYVPEFSVTGVNSIKKLCSEPVFSSLAFNKLFEVFISGSESFAFYTNRMRSNFSKEILKYKPEWQNNFYRSVRGYFNP